MRELGTFILPVVSTLPVSPSQGQVVHHSGQLKEYDGSAWHVLSDIEPTNLPQRDTYQANAGSQGTSSDSSHIHPDGEWHPLNFGYDAWTYPADMASSATAAMVSGTQYMARVFLDHTTSISKVYFKNQAASGTPTSGQTFAGLVDGSLNLLGSGHLSSTGSELSVAFASTGLIKCSITAQSGGSLTNLVPGIYGIVLFQVATTPATLSGQQNSASVNGLLTTANSKYGSAGTGRTTSFANPIGTLAAYSMGFWAAMSA